MVQDRFRVPYQCLFLPFYSYRQGEKTTLLKGVRLYLGCKGLVISYGEVVLRLQYEWFYNKTRWDRGGGRVAMHTSY